MTLGSVCGQFVAVRFEVKVVQLTPPSKLWSTRYVPDVPYPCQFNVTELQRTNELVFKTTPVMYGRIVKLPSESS
jgi:hypothetical protein